VLLFAGDPHNIPTATGDPFKTLFVARIVSVPIKIISLCLSQFRVWLPHMVLIRDWLFISELWHFRVQIAKRIWSLWTNKKGENLQLYMDWYVWSIIQSDSWRSSSKCHRNYKWCVLSASDVFVVLSFLFPFLFFFISPYVLVYVYLYVILVICMHYICMVVFVIWFNPLMINTHWDDVT